MTIDKKMAEYRMQTMRIAEEAQAIERQMDALKRLQVCVERGEWDGALDADGPCNQQRCDTRGIH